ncbi:MAG: hypothetical protein RIB65_14220 [Ilumatobacter fluminis]|uniref:hypothetical protein n=1 Tax=Ilumatobacter fluminis TaxID=467091 RepID=UPI0032EF9886
MVGWMLGCTPCFARPISALLEGRWPTETSSISSPILVAGCGGVWIGGYGLGFRSDEIVVSTSWDSIEGAAAAVETFCGLDGVDPVEATVYLPTVRPTDRTPVPATGVWVFRVFEIATGDVEEFVRLSAGGWETFEDALDVNVYGLFRASGDGPTTRMLLTTWYANLATWEASRSVDADPAAWDRFNKRQGLTIWTQGRSAVPAEL